MESGVPGGSGVRGKEMSRGKRATVGDEGGPPTPSQISDGCPKCCYSQFDALHSEPGELERRQCKSCGEVYGVKPLEQEISIFDGQEETMAKEKFKCDLCGRDNFKAEQGLKHHKTTAHGKAKAVDLTKLPCHPNTTPTVREEVIDTLRTKKNQLLQQVSEVDDLIEAMEKAGR